MTSVMCFNLIGKCNVLMFYPPTKPFYIHFEMGRLDFFCHIVSNLNWTKMVIVNVCLNVADVTKFSSLISIWMDRISKILLWSSLKNSTGWIHRNTAGEQKQMNMSVHLSTLFNLSMLIIGYIERGKRKTFDVILVFC